MFNYPAVLNLDPEPGNTKAPAAATTPLSEG